jgi:hypothetical protein
MGAMRGREGVADEDVAERGELGDESGVVAFSPAWKRVFSKQRMSPGFIALNRRRGLLAHAILGKRHRPLEDLRKAGAKRLQRLRRIGPFGRPKCDSRITLPPLSAISPMVGATRSMRVASATLAVLDRNVEIDAQGARVCPGGRPGRACGT